VTRLNPLVLRLLRLGLPMGPNTLMTVRGRKTGEPRTVPVAILRADGREVVFAAFGEVPWVHNLRAAGTATIGSGSRARAVRAVELEPEVAAHFLEAGLRPVMKVPLMGSMIAGWYGIDRRSTTEDYRAAARRHPAFELTPDKRT
jgi:deazaflavin-dependent oxidoreductase (nitroreductase family)